MKEIVFFNGAFIYIPKYNITISDADDDLAGMENAVWLFLWDKLLSDTGYLDVSDRQQSLDNVVESLQEAGYVIVRF